MASTGGTGVEWTEYRIDGGAWTRSENTGGADPFVTTFEVEDEGDHTVEFRSRDGSGNEEQIKQVSHQGELDDGIEAEKTGFAGVFSSADAREGIGAFLGKRTPRFKGE